MNAFNQHWVDPDLWRRLLAAMEPHHVTWVWVKGHAESELNNRCDELATGAADGTDLLEDKAFEREG